MQLPTNLKNKLHSLTGAFTKYQVCEYYSANIMVVFINSFVNKKGFHKLPN